MAPSPELCGYTDQLVCMQCDLFMYYFIYSFTNLEQVHYSYPKVFSIQCNRAVHTLILFSWTAFIELSL